jgi:hypothetical protein
MCVSAQTVTPASGTYELSFSLDKAPFDTGIWSATPLVLPSVIFQGWLKRGDVMSPSKKIPTLKHSLVHTLPKLRNLDIG